MTTENLINKIRSRPEDISFDEVMKYISDHYHYTPGQFSNGSVNNAAGSNEGSCKIFAFAKLAGLSESETLACFGQYYRNDVLAHPEGEDHANIRSFIKHGWQGVHFQSEVLKAK